MHYHCLIVDDETDLARMMCEYFEYALFFAVYFYYIRPFQKLEGSLRNWKLHAATAFKRNIRKRDSPTLSSAFGTDPYLRVKTTKSSKDEAVTL